MTNLQPNQTLHGFIVDRSTAVPEINGTAHVMHHVTSGAELLYLDNGEDEKGFAIGFRTCPADNTGVFHIIEHSVWCGSDKYPVKDPFVRMLKTSMKTALNAMTCNDCTMHYAASINEKDLKNLMDVCLDAVFHPAFLHTPEIFMQEGWHYEYDEEHIDINGVVYNEMKGSLAKPIRVLGKALNEELFPDTCYRFVTGGVPEDMEGLSYEQFVDSYRRHYRPDNAAIVLCGNLDVEVFLEAINAQLLSVASCAEGPVLVPNPRGVQKPIVSPHRKVFFDGLQQDAELLFGSAFGETDDRRRALAMTILGQALLGNSEAPLRRILLDAGFASKFSFGVGLSSKLVSTVRAIGVKPDSAELFLETLMGGCRQLLSEGLQKDMLEAAVFSAEFSMRTNGGNGNLSAVSQMQPCLTRWGAGHLLDAEALLHDDDLEFLNAAIDSDYYDNLLREAILESQHWALVELCPVSEEQSRSATSEPCLALSEPSADDLERIAQEAASLKAFQDKPNSPEALQLIPRLRREDCLEAPHQPGYRLVKEKPFDVLRHDYAEDGIAHVVRFYDLTSISQADLPYIKLLFMLLGDLDTLRHTAEEVIRLKYGRLGQFSSALSLSSSKLDGSLVAYAWVHTCSLADSIEFASDYVDEILHETIFSDRDKLREIVEIQYQQHMRALVTQPEGIASIRATAHIRAAAALADASGGYGSYKLVKDLRAACESDAGADEVLKRLEILCARLLNNKPMLVSFSGDDSTYKRFISAEQSILSKRKQRANDAPLNLADEEQVYESSPTLAEFEPLVGGDEAFIIPSDVAYCAETVDLSGTSGFDSGCWEIVRRAANLDYLWNNIRVKGGAYGASFSESEGGEADFLSFRDPEIDNTLLCFDNLGRWLREFEPTDDELDGYVISAVGAHDQPLKGFALISHQASSYLTGLTPEDEARTRQEIVSCTAGDIRRLGAELDECTGVRCTVVFAGRELLEQSKHSFDIIEID